MSHRIAVGSRIGRTIRFVRVNGLYVLLCGMGHHVGIAFRRWMLSSKLGCPDITIGPHCYLRGLSYMQIGRHFQVAEGLWMEAIASHQRQNDLPFIVIGNDVTISRWSHIAATHRIEIGDGVLIGSRVLITDHNHGQYKKGASDLDMPPSQRPLDQDKSVLIGKNVWLGDGVVVMPGVTIGDGSVIGANSVVTRDVPPFTIAAGAPVRMIRQYDFKTEDWRTL